MSLPEFQRTFWNVYNEQNQRMSEETFPNLLQFPALVHVPVDPAHLTAEDLKNLKFQEWLKQEIVKDTQQKHQEVQAAQDKLCKELGAARLFGK